MWRIPEYVRDANDDPAHLESLAEKMRDKKKPPFSVGSRATQYRESVNVHWVESFPISNAMGGLLLVSKRANL